jgi:hypothetical protein
MSRGEPVGQKERLCGFPARNFRGWKATFSDVERLVIYGIGVDFAAEWLTCRG